MARRQVIVLVGIIAVLAGFGGQRLVGQAQSSSVQAADQSGSELSHSLSARAGAGLPCIAFILSRCLLSSNFGASAACAVGGKNKLKMANINNATRRATLFIGACSAKDSCGASETLIDCRGYFEAGFQFLSEFSSASFTGGIFTPAMRSFEMSSTQLERGVFAATR